MDRGPAKLPNIASRLIAMAVRLAGSEAVVMHAMRAIETDFSAYRRGEKEPPWPEFDRLVQLVVDEQQKGIERRRAQIARVRQKVDERKPGR